MRPVRQTQHLLAGLGICIRATDARATPALSTAGGKVAFGWIERWHLHAMGLASEHDDGSISLSIDGLARYKPPDDAVDDTPTASALGKPVAYMVGCGVDRPTRFTRLAIGAACWLWTERQMYEVRGFNDVLGVVTPAAWCTACGRHFSASVAIDPRSGHGPARPVARWCESCAGRGVRHAPMVKCAAQDCDRWVVRRDRRQAYCSDACVEADRRRRIEFKRRRLLRGTNPGTNLSESQNT